MRMAQFSVWKYQKYLTHPNLLDDFLVDWHSCRTLYDGSVVHFPHLKQESAWQYEHNTNRYLLIFAIFKKHIKLDSLQYKRYFTQNLISN